MRFQAEHRFQAPPAAVAAVLTDPGFYAQLALPDLSLPEVLAGEGGEEAVLRLRYQFLGSLDPTARRLLGAARLSWIQELHLDPSSGAGTLRFASEADPGRLHGSARFVLAGEDAGTLRRLEGDLVVSVPLIGQMAERRIVPGLLRRLDLEAVAISERLAGAAAS